jgi:uracil-DNA glycosylase
VSQEKRNCEKFLSKELLNFAPSRQAKNRVILCLGRDAYEALNRLFKLPTKPFAHGLHIQVQKNLFLLTSFHPSRLNVNTKRLTQEMFDAVLGNAESLLRV